MQKILSDEQVAAFYHDCFVKQQVEHFSQITAPCLQGGHVIVDVGGGCGYFASAIQNQLNIRARLIDMDPMSVNTARTLGVEAMIGDALKPIKQGDEVIACFNLILHHLVGNSEKQTLKLQKIAVSAWHEGDTRLFVNEYIYESWFGGISGWLIYQITKNELLSSVAKAIAKIVPSLRANTFGVGVRFRTSYEWRKLFSSAGFKVIDEIKGDDEFIALPLRLLLIKSIRRDSFLLAPK